MTENARRRCVRAADALRYARERAGLTRDPALYAAEEKAQREAMDAARALARAEIEQRSRRLEAARDEPLTLVSDPRELWRVPMDFSCASTVRDERAEREDMAEEHERRRS